MPPTKDYVAPTPEMCEFLISSLAHLSGAEQMESQDFAKRLYDVYDGPKKEITHNRILDTFPWLNQIGVIDYKSKWAQRGGNRLYIWRKAEPSQLRSLIGSRSTISVEGAKLAEPVVQASQPVTNTFPEVLPMKQARLGKHPLAASQPEKKKRKRCCDEPRIVRVKKTGKRRCKNCGTKLKTKKAGA